MSIYRNNRRCDTGKIKTLFALLFVIIVIYFMFDDNSVKLGPGVKVHKAPEQSTTSAAPFLFKGYTITPVADFAIRAKVLSRERYYTDLSSELSPVDLALGWKRMSDENVLEKIDISQSGRWYRWKTKRFPIPRSEIETCSANMHMIPANEIIEDVILSAKKGQIISLRGYLVRITGENNFRWNSSQTRNDTGDGSCEIIYVTDFFIDIAE